MPLTSINILVLAVLLECMLGTIKERSLEVWASKYHVILLVIFSFPLLLVTVFEVVAMTVASPSTFGQIHMQSVGAIGGPSNQVLGSVNSNGWWFGFADDAFMWISMTCYLGILASLTVFPYLITCIGLRGPKAPPYL